METRVGDLEVSYSARGARTYRLELWHPGLSKHRVIKGNEASIVERKVELQIEDWSQKWAAAERREESSRLRDNKKQQQEEQKELAAERTAEAQAELEALETVLAHTLSVDDAIDWDSLRDHSEFTEPSPQSPPKPSPAPVEPLSSVYEPTLTFLDRLVASRRQRKVEQATASYELARTRWQDEVVAAREREEAWQLGVEAAIVDWEERRKKFLSAQQEANAVVDRERAAYEAGDPDALLDYCDLVLSRSDYPSCMPNEWRLDYVAENRTLVVEYDLPDLDSIPTLVEVRYVQSRDEFTEKELPDSKVRSLYDALLYQVALRTVHELFEADTLGGLDAIVFNGCVTSVDPRTGHEATGCILSLQAAKDEFLAVNLSQVDPKACFKALKGVGSSRLHSLTPVAPIMQMRREDGRFVSAREIANTLDDSMNLAAMDWEDFEHLIRELFEQEFQTSGGEVKVTQASRDGGVDAIAFDPDPIRGGKIVIQAKRYTNVVGVAAVRDLYGTVVNEGATKGILVTTSDYGPDAYSFAKDKPLTLLNGANLLHLLGKHGTRARIDIPEARKVLGL